MRKSLYLLVAVAVLSLGLVACTAPPPEPTPEPTPEATQTPVNETDFNPPVVAPVAQ